MLVLQGSNTGCSSGLRWTAGPVPGALLGPDYQIMQSCTRACAKDSLRLLSFYKACPEAF